MDDSNNFMALLSGITAFAVDGHEVHNLADSFLREKPRYKDVGFREIHLAAVRVPIGSGDLKEPALRVVQDPGEYAWRVKARETTPVDGTIHSYKSDRVHVPDYAVGSDTVISHLSPMES
jgi:hypothetical protein